LWGKQKSFMVHHKVFFESHVIERKKKKVNLLVCRFSWLATYEQNCTNCVRCPRRHRHFSTYCQPHPCVFLFCFFLFFIPPMVQMGRWVRGSLAASRKEKPVGACMDVYGGNTPLRSRDVQHKHSRIYWTPWVLPSSFLQDFNCQATANSLLLKYTAHSYYWKPSGSKKFKL
jgi:hypothetical protein